jgi:hypothetical protein
MINKNGNGIEVKRWEKGWEDMDMEGLAEKSGLRPGPPVTAERPWELQFTSGIPSYIYNPPKWPAMLWISRKLSNLRASITILTQFMISTQPRQLQRNNLSW